MSVLLEAAPDRGLKIRTVRTKFGRMATLLVHIKVCVNQSFSCNSWSFTKRESKVK